MLQKFPKLFLYLLGVVFIINLLQSYFTELIFDEAYYWYFSQHMAWGYFDHPPMVALLIKISSFFFSGELGVRFMSCVLSIGTLIILWLLIDNKRKKEYITHFFILTFSVTLLNAYGFFTLPDTPLLFFTALFLLVYKRFLTKPSFSLAIGMGLVMAALMYSKYHAILVIFFVLLSNLKLLANKYAWMAVFIALVAYIPHFIWLYDHDFISIKYHLFERPNEAYDFKQFTLGYFLNLFALFGLIFPWVYRALFKTGITDLFTKALVYLTYGVLVFFFISSLHRIVQTQWIIVISIPLTIMTFNDMLINESTRKWIFRLGLVNIVLLSILRIGLIYEPLFPVTYESHGNKKWVRKVALIAGDMPVVFENSYRLAPMYAFYSGKTSFSLNNTMYRENEYSIDESESKVQHKNILYLSQYIPERDIQIANLNESTYYGKIIDDFESYRKLKCFVDTRKFENPWGSEHTLKVYNPYDIDIDLKKIRFGVTYLNDYKRPVDIIPIQDVRPENKNLTLKSNDTTFFTFKLPKPLMENPVYFRIGISENGLHYGLNGQNIRLD
ncbi:MAG: glycosyltransferase family 39 protein [Maribacter sp.]|nr:glycosyltransferase family 39 protein [Maribacter sp.]